MIKMRSSTWLDTKAVQAAVHEASLEPLEKCALAVRKEAQASIKGGRVGTKGAPNAYYHREKKKWVIGGAPGKPPRSQSGTLRGNIRFALTSRGTYIIGPTTTAWYGRMHEFGLQTKTGKVKRPFMRPALYRTIYKFTDFFKGMDLGKTSAGRALNRARKRKK